MSRSNTNWRVIFIEVAGGVADIGNSVPNGIQVEFIDYDNLGIGKLTSEHFTTEDAVNGWNGLSAEAKQFIRTKRPEEYARLKQIQRGE